MESYWAQRPHRIARLMWRRLKIDDLNSPITKHFEGHDVLSYIDELYHFPPNGPYSREKLHVLMSINMAKSPPRERRESGPTMIMDSSGSKAMAAGGSSTARWVTRCCCLALRRWPS